MDVAAFVFVPVNVNFPTIFRGNATLTLKLLKLYFEFQAA